MGREPDEVALQRGPDGLRPTSSRDCGHLILLAGIGAAGGDTAGREPEHWNRPGRAGRARHPGRTRTKNPAQTIHHRLSCKTGCRTAKLDEPTRSYRSRREKCDSDPTGPGRAGWAGHPNQTPTKGPARCARALLEPQNTVPHGGLG